jgi:hypothetical protein
LFSGGGASHRSCHCEECNDEAVSEYHGIAASAFGLLAMTMIMVKVSCGRPIVAACGVYGAGARE